VTQDTLGAVRLTTGCQAARSECLRKQHLAAPHRICTTMATDIETKICRDRSKFSAEFNTCTLKNILNGPNERQETKYSGKFKILNSRQIKSNSAQT
jgi:hypothetical protein